MGLLNVRIIATLCPDKMCITEIGATKTCPDIV
nr:MAG TPA: hypothetical protein [Caudoviricetes sp.]